MSEDAETLRQLEAALAESSDGFYRLRLYVTGSTPRSSRAIANLRAILEEHVPGRYELDVVDLYQQPHLAKDAQVIAAPTLVKELPEPVRKIVGDMSNEDRVLIGLDIQRLEEE